MINLIKARIENAQNPQIEDLGNSILYKLCGKYFTHKENNEILMKVLFIGRIYAAAVERRRNKQENDTNTNFYLDKIVPLFKKSKIDICLDKLKDTKLNIENIESINLYLNDIKFILRTHFHLMFLLKQVTNQSKRSFCSKYLHFHLPDVFFLYDSRALEGLKYIDKCFNLSQEVKKLQSKIEISCKDKVDKRYMEFFLKCLLLQIKIKQQFNIHLTNRQIDNLLLGLNPI